MARLPRTMSLTRGAGTRSAMDSAWADMPSGSRNSLRRMSPGVASGMRSPVETSEKSRFSSSERLMTMMVSHDSVIVDDLDIERVAVDVLETDAPLRVDTDAPLPAARALQQVEAVAGRH